MSAPMTMQQLGDLIKHIRDHHSIDTTNRKGKLVKYVHPNIDMRDGKCFSVRLRGYGWDELLHTQNECRDLPESLDQRIRAFLEENKHG